jgi:hypothetical protein
MAADMLPKRCRVATFCLLLKAAGRGRHVDSSSGFQRLASCAHAGMPVPARNAEHNPDVIRANSKLVSMPDNAHR